MRRHHQQVHGPLEVNEQAQLQHFQKSQIPTFDPQSFYCRSALLNIVTESIVVDKFPKPQSFVPTEEKAKAIEVLEELLKETTDYSVRRMLKK